MKNILLFLCGVNCFPHIIMVSAIQTFITSRGGEALFTAAVTSISILVNFKFLFSDYIENNDLPIISNYFTREKSWMLLAQALFSSSLIICAFLPIRWVIVPIIIAMIADIIYDISFAKIQVEIGTKKGSHTFFQAHKVSALLSTISLIFLQLFGYRIALLIMFSISIFGFIPIYLLPSGPVFKNNNLSIFNKIWNNRKNILLYLFFKLMYYLLFFKFRHMAYKIEHSTHLLKTVTYLGVMIAVDVLGDIFFLMEKYSLSSAMHFLRILDFFQIVDFNYFPNIHNMMRKPFSEVFALGWFFYLFSLLSKYHTYTKDIRNIIYNVVFKISQLFISNTKIFQSSNNKESNSNSIIPHSVLLAGIFSLQITSLLWRWCHNLIAYGIILVSNFIPIYILCLILPLIIFIIINAHNKMFFREKFLQTTNLIKTKTYNFLSRIKGYESIILFVFIMKSAKMLGHGPRSYLIYTMKGPWVNITHHSITIFAGMLGGVLAKLLMDKRKNNKISVRTLCMWIGMLSLTDCITGILTLSNSNVIGVIVNGLEHVINGITMSIIMNLLFFVSKSDPGFLYTFLWGVFGISRVIFKYLGTFLGKNFHVINQTGLYSLTNSAFYIVPIILVILPFIVILYGNFSKFTYEETPTTK